MADLYDTLVSALAYFNNLDEADLCRHGMAGAEPSYSTLTVDLAKHVQGVHTNEGRKRGDLGDLLSEQILDRLTKHSAIK
jgi:hypothetical protein